MDKTRQVRISSFPTIPVDYRRTSTSMPSAADNAFRLSRNAVGLRS
jgi:hypothetical protein